MKCIAFMDLRTAGVMIQILKLMALSDGNVAPEEEELLESLGKRYLKEASIPSWTAAFNHPNDLEILAQEIPEMHRALTAKLAYMVIAASRDAYQFTVNSDEQKAFDRLCDQLALDQNTRDELAAQAKNDLSERPGLWEILYSNFSSQFSMGNTPCLF
jgi:uncharacterized membrane protein YebE (DUF533 family)